jgi:hypothetical protein
MGFGCAYCQQRGNPQTRGSAACTCKIHSAPSSDTCFRQRVDSVRRCTNLTSPTAITRLPRLPQNQQSQLQPTRGHPAARTRDTREARPPAQVSRRQCHRLRAATCTTPSMILARIPAALLRTSEPCRSTLRHASKMARRLAKKGCANVEPFCRIDSRRDRRLWYRCDHRRPRVRVRRLRSKPSSQQCDGPMHLGRTR